MRNETVLADPSERPAILADIAASFGADLSARCSLCPAKLAEDYLSEERVRQQIDILQSAAGSLRGRRVLEVGSGYGMFIAVSTREFGADCFGVEPGGEGHADAVGIAHRVLALHGIEQWRVLPGTGEYLPLRSESVDIVYSCNVLEHVQDPRSVLEEAVRVLRPDGLLFFVVPNYGSFWEGHYGLPWLPYMSHRFARLYVRLWGKAPAFLDSLHLVNYFSLHRALRAVKDQIQILGWGEDTFRYRMKTLDFGEWAAVGSLKRVVRLGKMLHLNDLVAEILVRLKAHTPLIITASKKG